jgi:hypothetical protein
VPATIDREATVTTSFAPRPAIRATLLASLLLAGLGGAAGAQSPALYFQQNQACLSEPHCLIPANNAEPVPSGAYTTLATLVLPKGHYLIRSKLSAYSQNATGIFILECALLEGELTTPLDSSAFDGLFQRTVFLQTPLSLQAHAGGTVRVGCRASGRQADGSASDLRVWNADIAAIAVRSIERHYP